MELAASFSPRELRAFPSDWEFVDLGFLRPFVTSGSRGWARFYSDHGSPFIRITNLTRESIYLDLVDLKHVDLPPDVREGTRTQLREDDVLISITADIGIVACVTGDLPQPAYINQHLALVRFDRSRVSGRFAAYFLASTSSQKGIRSLVDMGAKAGMSLLTIQSLKLYLPRPAEQRAIAKALSDVDTLVEGLEQLIAKKRDLRQATLQQLLTGQTRLAGFTGEWEVRQLGDVAEVDPDNLRGDTRPDFAFNYIALDDVDSGELKSHSRQVFGTAPSRARRRVRRHDLLVSTVRPNLKSHLLFRMNDPDWVCSTGFSVVRSKTRIAHPDYLFFQMFGHTVSRQIETLLAGSNYPAINSRDVRALGIPMPDYHEQIAIAAVLSDMDAEIDALEARAAKTRDLKEAMAQELISGRTRLV